MIFDGLPCPFCEERRSRAFRPMIHPGNATFWAIYCLACRASGPWAKSPEEALSRWEALIASGLKD